MSDIEKLIEKVQEMRKPFSPGGIFGADIEMGHLTKKHKLWLDIIIAIAAVIQVVGTVMLTLKGYGWA